jgi:hypothetical protein
MADLSETNTDNADFSQGDLHTIARQAWLCNRGNLCGDNALRFTEPDGRSSAARRDQ